MKIYEYNGVRPQISNESYIFDNVVIIGDVIIEKNVSIWPGAIIRGDKERIIIKEGSNIQENSILHTNPGSPLIIESNCTIGHGVILHGCKIGSHCVVGIGAIILDNVVLGHNCFITAGALLSFGPKYLENSIISGNPAKIISCENDYERSQNAALEYIELAKTYSNKNLKQIKLGV